ncbi:MAG TPA: amidohydrolase family protein [Rubrivivax sp.]
MIVDAHFHSWRLDRGDYGWLTPALAPIYRDVAIADWRLQSQPCGVTAGVLVQAAPTEAETAWLLAEAKGEDSVLAVVGWADLLAADVAARITALALQPKLRGLRPMLHDIADPDWILQPALAPALQAMERAGLVFEALVKPQHLPRVAELARRHTGLVIVVDHAAKPDIAQAQWQPWADDLALVAAHPNVVCKLSGLLTEAGPAPRADAARRWALHVLAAFAPQRVLWGSDWPVLELAAGYDAWWQETQSLLAAFAPEQRKAVLGGNALRVYGPRTP